MVGREAARGREGYRVEIQFSYFLSYSSSMWSTDYSFWLCSSLLWFIVPTLSFFFYLSEKKISPVLSVFVNDF